ncbi:hypothetical protein ABEV11_03905 [Anoxybacillus kestanbolensis]
MLHDERGHVRTFTTGNGAGATFTYDDRGLVKSLLVGTADGTELLAETYRYDENGNRTEIAIPLRNRKMRGKSLPHFTQ